MKRLLIIGGGEMQVPIIKKAKELKNYCIVSDFDPLAPGFKYADVCINVSTLDLNKTLEIAQKYKIDGVITTSDYPVRTLAYICDKTGLKGLSSYSAGICTDKFLQREILSSTKYYVPKHFMFSSVKEMQSHINDLSFPLIVKPIDSSASRGVSKVENREELIPAFNDALGFSHGEKVIIEEFIYGREYSVESLTQNNKTHVIAITQKSTNGSNNKYFVESRHIVPADLSGEEKSDIESYVRDIIKTLKINNSATHTEIKLSPKGIVMMEIGGRLGGDFITSDLVPLSTGIDMLDNIIKIALGEKINIKKTRSTFAGIRFINSDNYSNAKRIVDSKNKQIIKYNFKPYKNTQITNSLDRLGYVIACCPERKELEDLLNF